MKKTRRRVLWGTTRLLGGGLVLAVLLFLGSNLFLATGWGRGLLVKQVTRRAPRLTWAVEGATWSPWNGFSLRGLSARIPGNTEAPPILSLPAARLKPYWSQALRGRRIFRELVLDGPEIQLPIEALFVVRPQPVPSLVSEEESAPPPAETPPPKPTEQEPPSPGTLAAEKPVEKGPPRQPTSTKPTEPTEPVPDPRLWLRIHNARVRLYSFSNPHSIAVEGLDIQLPLAGPATTGAIHWEKIALNGATLSAVTHLPIEWKDRRWILPPTPFPLTLPQLGQGEKLAPLALNTQLAGSLMVRGSGKRFTLQGYLPLQALPTYCLHDQAELIVSAQEMSANFTSSGRLSDPASWQFDSLAVVNGIDLSSWIRDQHFLFETARSKVTLRQGVIEAPLLDLRSERVSLLGNGQLSLEGYLLGVLRIVAEPELEEEITKIAIGSFLSEGWISNWMQPLETPDRYYRDLHIEGPLPDPQISIGRHGKFLALSQVRQLIQGFLDQEIAEEPGH